MAQSVLIHPGSHLSIGARGGVAGFSAQSIFKSKTQLGLGTSIDLSYAYFITNGVGIRTGFYLTTVSNSISVSDVETVLSAPSPYLTGVVDNYTAVTPLLTENYAAVLGEIPIQLALRGDHWYSNLGVKMLLPYKIESSYHYDESPITYENSVNNALSNTRRNNKTTYIPNPDPYPEQNGTYTLYNAKDDVDFLDRPWYLLIALEAGYRVGCECGHSWVIGLYFDYALNRLNSNSSDRSLLYISPEVSEAADPTAAAAESGTLPPGITHTNGAWLSTALTSLGFFDFGVKLQYDIGLTQR